jgi:hypothetical protein
MFPKFTDLIVFTILSSHLGGQYKLKLKALNTLIDVAEEQLKIDIRKKSGARQSSK